MIYSHKPQRSGRSIAANTNNPPQDPPPSKQNPPKSIDVMPKVSYEIPDIPIENTIPPVPELCIKEKLVIAPTKKANQQPQKKIIPKQQPHKPKITKSQTIKKLQKEIFPPKTVSSSSFRRFLTKIKSIFGRK